MATFKIKFEEVGELDDSEASELFGILFEIQSEIGKGITDGVLDGRKEKCVIGRWECMTPPNDNIVFSNNFSILLEIYSSKEGNKK